MSEQMKPQCCWLTILLSCSWCSYPQEAPAYAKLRVERMNARMQGMRAKKAREAKEAEEKA